MFRKALIAAFALALCSAFTGATPAHAGLTHVKAATAAPASAAFRKAARYRYARLPCVRAPRVLILGVAY